MCQIIKNNYFWEKNCEGFKTKIIHKNVKIVDKISTGNDDDEELLSEENFIYNQSKEVGLLYLVYLDWFLYFFTYFINI